jgi:2-methylcitrate dehydratase PrpD
MKPNNGIGSPKNATIALLVSDVNTSGRDDRRSVMIAAARDLGEPPAVTRRLAELTASLRFADLPRPVRERVHDLVLDAVGNALGGHGSAEAAQVLAFARGLGSSGDASLIGGEHVSPAGAVLGNGYLITALTMCDIHRPTTCHVTPEVVSAALVAAEQEHATGAEFLAAVAAGLEVTTRVGLGLDRAAFRSRGWHTPGVTGPFGAAAAVGRLLGLDAERQNHAFGLAGSQSAGTYAHLGTPTMKFQQARGALSGYLAARLAAEGFTASADVLSHPEGGLYPTYAGGGDAAAALDGLGHRWELEQISLRAWPVAVHLMPVVTGLLDIVAGGGPPADDIRAVHVRVSPQAFEMHGEVLWDSVFRARLSTRYVTSAVLRDRSCGLAQFSAERVADPALTEFARGRVRVEADPNLRNGTARVSVTARDGSVDETTVDVARGEPARPLSRTELDAKFHELAGLRLPPDALAAAASTVRDIEHLPDMAVLLDALRAPALQAAR